MVKQSCVSTNDKSFSPILACCNAFFQASDGPTNAMMSLRLIGRKSLIWTVVRKRTARYPKLGARGLGGERAVRCGMTLESYVGAANEETLVIPVIETKEASANIAGILSVPGPEASFSGRPTFRKALVTSASGRGRASNRRSLRTRGSRCASSQEPAIPALNRSQA
jgi:hypothetical protein